jgi:ABC-2 type transport system permease protein
MFSAMLTPMAVLFVFSIISNGALLKYAVLGGFITILASNSLSTMFDAAQMRLDTKFQDLFVASRMDVVDFVSGLGISNLVYSLPEIAVYIVIAVVFGVFTPASFLLMAVILLPLSVAMTSIGVLFSYIPSHFRNIWGMFSIISLLFTFVPPIYYPYSLLPKPLLYIFALSPATPAAVLIQNVTGLQPFGAVSYIMVGVLLAETLAFLLMLMKFAKWRED